MATQQTWTWKQPIGGKTITWKPITVGDEMDIDAAYRHDNNRHLNKYMRLAVRITALDGAAKRVELHDIRNWDSFDLDSFYEEVQLQEAKRAASLGKADQANPATMYRAAAARVEVAMAEMAGALRDAGSAVEAAMSRPTETPQPQ